MREIRLIALDLDGTLLDSEKRLSNRNKEALLRCAEMGIQIVPATGRTVGGIIPEIRYLFGVNYAITTNGAEVVDLKTQRVLKKCLLSNETTLRILNVVKKYHVMYDPYIDGRGITQPEFIDHMSEYGLSSVLQDLVRSTRDVYPDIIQEVKKSKKAAEKVNIFFSDLNDREMVRKELSSISGLIITSSLSNNLEINAEDATKGNALLWLSDYLGIDRMETIAFGDGENDPTMLKAAGVGIAMENGSEGAKLAADMQTLTNDKDGVAVAIEHLIFNKI